MELVNGIVAGSSDLTSMRYPGCMVVSRSILDVYQKILTSLLVMGISTFTSKDFVFLQGPSG